MANILFVLLFILTLSPPALTQVNRAPLRIGVITSLSGPMKEMGQQAANGMKLAVESFKQENEELASFIQINLKDDQSLPSKAVDQAKALIEARAADVFIGPLTSVATFEVAPIVEASRRPFITASETSIPNTPSNSHFFRSSVADEYQAILVARFSYQKFGKTTTIIFQKDSQYSTQIKETYEKEFKRLGGSIVDSEFFVEGVSDFSPMLKNIKKHNPSSVFAPVFYDNAAPIITQGKKLGIGAPFLGITAWDSPKLYADASKVAITGHFFPAYFSDDDPSDKMKDFIQSYRRRFGRKPNVYASQGYDAMMLALEAYKKANTSRTSPYENSLERISLPSALYPMDSFDKNGNAKRSISIRKTSPSGSEFYDNISFADPTKK